MARLRRTARRDDEASVAPDLAIEVSGLTKSYGDHAVLTGVDLTVPKGTVYALLGPNGAGRTTVVNILSTLLTPDDGVIRVAGFDVRREAAGVRAAIGVTGPFSAIDELLTGAENLRLMADLAQLKWTIVREQLADGVTVLAAMPPGLRQFAQHQPFTPMIDTLRALVTGAPPGFDLWLAIGWCALIALLGHLWSRRPFLRVPAK